jgi:hypothetical protein
LLIVVVVVVICDTVKAEVSVGGQVKPAEFELRTVGEGLVVCTALHVLAGDNRVPHKGF